MIIKLKYPPVPENASALAEVAVEGAREVARVELDYSLLSLERVDAILEQMRTERIPVETVATVMFCFGCYLGEVFVRAGHGSWKLAAETPLAGFIDYPLVLELNQGKFCNPIGKVFKNLESGAEENLLYFYRVFTGS